MSVSEIVSLLSGVALFLFGMTLMGDGLKKVAAGKLEIILYRLSSTPLKGLLLGTGVTAVIQSSCATSIMVVGFVNSGMMKLRQSISVIIGAILGTSVTGFVLCLSYIDSGSGWKSLLSTATITGVIATVGIIMRIFMKSQVKKNIGDILMGFAVLMFGMSAMSSAVSPLSESEWFTSFLSTLSNPLLGILAGTVFTAVLQSASAAVGVIQALAVTGAISFGGALSLLMGVAIGAATPVMLSAIGASTNGKRASAVYPIASVIGVAICAAVFFPLNAVFSFEFMNMKVSPFTVAVANSGLRILMAAVLMPLIGVIKKLTELIVKDKQKDDGGLKLEERFLSYPTLAIMQSRMAAVKIAALAQESVNKATSLFEEYSKEKFSDVQKIESDVDSYEDQLGSYLMLLTGRELSDDESSDVTEYIHTLTDFERITDHALSVAYAFEDLHNKELSFSDASREDLSVLFSAVNEVIRLSTAAFADDDNRSARRVEPLRDHIDELCVSMKNKHLARLKSGECKIVQGLLFNELLTDTCRIAAHCSNIAAAVLQLKSGVLESHEYLQNVKEEGANKFDRYLDEYQEKYEV